MRLLRWRQLRLLPRRQRRHLGLLCGRQRLTLRLLRTLRRLSGLWRLCRLRLLRRLRTLWLLSLRSWRLGLGSRGLRLWSWSL